MPHARTVGGSTRATQTLCENPLAKRGAGTQRCATRVTLTVPKKSKTEDTDAAVPAEPVISAVEAQPSTELKKQPARKASAKKATATKKSGSKSAAKKSSAKKSARKSASRKSAAGKHGAEPSDEDIRIRAYFIAERRMQLSLDGDPANDWIQARQELIAEGGESSQNGNGSH